MSQMNEVRAVVLAGGSGTRLWPLSRVQAPKQFLKVLGTETLLEATIARLRPGICDEQVLIVTNEETAQGEGYRPLAAYEKLLEPVPRNTAAAIGIAATRFASAGLDPVLVVLPSDHLIRDVPAFQDCLSQAVEAAAAGKLVTFGIDPTSPETGFGYVHAPGTGSVRPVRGFREKPDRATAERFVASREYFWNSGMFVWRASRILAEIGATLPALSAVLDRIRKDSQSLGIQEAVKRHFAEAPSISIDHGVLEKSRELVMVPGRFGWSDVGSWDSVYDMADKNGEGNAIQGNVLAIDSRDSFVRSESRLVAALGVSDLSIIETRDAVLVARRGHGQDVRKVVDALAQRAAAEHVVHRTVQRPWGSYTVLEDGEGFKIKRIEVRPGGRLSLQRHKHRAEHWVVLSGEATVTRDGATTVLHANQSTYIPVMGLHRLENRAATALHIIEVQVGSYVGEDDIERFEDQYGRAREAGVAK